MALPDLIEIIPLAQPVRAEITVPGSKSITNRALILAALAEGEVTLTGALWSEDTQVMTEALRTLGFDVRVENDPAEFCNRTITVKGQGGKIPKAGTAEQPLELFVGNAGTAARFLAAMVCLGDGVYRLSGVPRMHERPQAALFRALRELGYRVDATNDKLPAVIHGQVRGEKAEVRSCTVSIDESSQFASALLLSAKHGGWNVKVAGDDDEEAPYVTMTERLVEVFPWEGGKFQIEPDASGGSYFLAADWVTWIARKNPEMGLITVAHWPKTNWQIDSDYPKYRNLVELKGFLSRKIHLGDSIMTAIAKAPLNRALQSSQMAGTTGMAEPIRFTDLGRLRVQECERVVALREQLTRIGAHVVENGDTLTVYSDRTLHGAEIETYNDHRMAMCFAILGLKVPGIRLKNPSCVKKTFPNFFQKLAAAPPNGLGVEIWEVKDGKRTRKLAGEDLFAE
jgi:3-phosphoshikimate 1-carboxyvinyltransferase